jgi:glucose/arabinose dehydrogenase
MALAFHPDTGDLAALVQERDGLGDNLPSGFLIRVQQGGFYGWPYAYIGKHPIPRFARLAPDKVEASITPDLLFTARSSLLDLVFYGRPVPGGIQGQPVCGAEALVEPLCADRLQSRARAVQGRRPEGWYENFATGFWASGEQRAEVWGRPAALAVAKDGSLLVADDTGGTIWHISYKGPPRPSTPLCPPRRGSDQKSQAFGR